MFEEKVEVAKDGVQRLMDAGFIREVTDPQWLLAVLKPNRIIHKCTDANCSSFHLRVLLGLSNPQG
jgi:hypothetical protein